MTSPAPNLRLVALLLTTTVFTMGDGSIHILLPPHLEAQGFESRAIGFTVASYSIAALFFRFVSGHVYRPSRMVAVTSGGCLLSALAFLLLAGGSSPPVLVAASALNGVGYALASTGGLAAIMDLRSRDSPGALMGWYTGCIGAGYALAGFAAGAIADAVSVPTAIGLTALAPVGAAVGFAVFMRSQDSLVPDVGPTALRAGLRLITTSATPAIILAIGVGVHINLIHGITSAFFPIYGLAIGLSLTQVGALMGAHSAMGSFIRFLAPALFRRVNYRRLIPGLVLLGSICLAALGVPATFGLLMPLWLGLGLGRGLLRVASSALVMEGSADEGTDRGAASGLYLAGMDTGKIVGPIAGGFMVSAVGIPTTFAITGLTIPLIFAALAAWQRKHR